MGYRDKKVFIDLYKTYVRPQLEYCSPTWSPWTVGDTDLREAVQRRAVKAVTNLTSKNYEERLQELGLDTLKVRRQHGDLIQAYKVFSGHDKVDPATWFQRSNEGAGARTRRQDGFWNVNKPEWDGEVRKNFWLVRVCDPWNSLPDDLKMSETVNGFKNGLDELQGWGKWQKRP